MEGDWWEVGGGEKPPTVRGLSSTAHTLLEETAIIDSRQNLNSYLAM